MLEVGPHSVVTAGMQIGTAHRCHSSVHVFARMSIQTSTEEWRECTYTRMHSCGMSVLVIGHHDVHWFVVMCFCGRIFMPSIALRGVCYLFEDVRSVFILWITLC